MSRLLLVDDDERFLAALTIQLEDAGFEIVAWARNGASACLQRRREDLVLGGCGLLDGFQPRIREAGVDAAPVVGAEAFEEAA